MANKRDLKRAIKAACGNMAGECIITRNFVEGVDRAKMADIIFNIADLQCASIEKVSFAYDKSAKSFDNRHLYNVARKKYFRKAYGKLIKDFKEGMNDIVKQMNEALPAKHKELNKAKAAK